MATWPYNTPAWQRLRRRKLNTTPLCEVCNKLDRLVPAKAVDHIVAINGGGEAFPPLDGLMSLCQACHNIKTTALERADGRGIAYKGGDANGLPIDPLHPFYAHTPSNHENLQALGPAPQSKFELES